MANRQLYIDAEAVTALALLKEQLLYPAVKLMNEEESISVNKTGMYHGLTYPFAFKLAPSGKRNKQVLISIKENEELDLVCEKIKVGTITANTVFKINKEQRLINIYGTNNLDHHGASFTNSRLGEYAIEGDFSININDIKKYKDNIARHIKKIDAKNISSLIIGTKPFHRVHERLIRTALVNSDLVILFLDKPANTKEDDIPFETRYETLQYFIDNFVPKDKVVIVPLENTYIFAGLNKLTLNAIVARNFGATKLIIGKNHKGIGAYYDHDEFNSIIDGFKNVDIKIEIMSEFVYCNECTTLVSTNACPHGRHHHILYHGDSIMKLIKLGIMPPAILMRPEISSIILRDILPHNKEILAQIHQHLSPSSGLLDDFETNDFYRSLMNLYQTSSLT